MRGLLLAVSTFAFGIACEPYLYGRDIFQGEGYTAASFQWDRRLQLARLLLRGAGIQQQPAAMPSLRPLQKVAPANPNGTGATLASKSLLPFRPPQGLMASLPASASA
ncbi:hypothetical protein [Actinomadura rugatobispora]|uniref:Uncharacterized protein n=1 Tax=Actinomadura rugatobispora TaxID=1994 RepID=A0ABW1A146_9ACTN|nr:hypothetical protein GCM10010200_083170 [Actinomadura rugatobispora]